MKNLYCLFFVFFTILNINAQLSFAIEEMSISYYNTTKYKNVINSDYEQGPYLGASCTIKNLSTKNFILYPSKSIMYLHFKYQEREYRSRIYSFAFMENDSLILSPNDSVAFCISDFFLLGTPIYNWKKWDYTKELLEILPTVRIKYWQKDMDLYTTEIKKVDIR